MKIYYLENWSKDAAEMIQLSVESALSHQGKCSVLLTGGRSALALYKEWALLPAFQGLKNTNFYLGDERCLPLNHLDSNYLMITRSLFLYGVPEGCTFNFFDANASDLNEEIERYQNLLPEYLDVALFGIGDDGHIASIFPHSPISENSNSRLALTKATKPPILRLTITPKVISTCHNIFALAPGKKKAQVCNSIVEDGAGGGFISLPAKLIKDSSWLLDKND